MRNPRKYVFYSKTRDNPFLPAWYADELEKSLDPKMKLRMVDGKWVDIDGEGVYHAYKKSNNYMNATYEIQPREPIYISWDFNIGEGKPMSLCLFQLIKDHMHIFDEVVAKGLRTLDTCEELVAKGYLDKPYRFILTGDATGKSRDTRSRKSDYDIIKSFFSNHQSDNKEISQVLYEVYVFSSNGAIRKRHNLVNSYCENGKGQHRLTIYSTAPTADKGLQRTVLKKGVDIVEDDGPKHPYQHISTAIGYGLRAAISKSKNADQPDYIIL